MPAGQDVRESQEKPGEASAHLQRWPARPDGDRAGQHKVNGERADGLQDAGSQQTAAARRRVGFPRRVCDGRRRAMGWKEIFD